MLVAIANTPQPYAWGSRTAISALLGTEPSGGPEAELWLGSHPGSPSRLADGSGTLDRWLAEHGRPPVPFLMKVLAAAAPLSLQAHPSADRARAGFEREEALGIPRDAPFRNYRDPFPKPEMLVALSPAFHALCGFRPVPEAIATLDALVARDPGAVVRLRDELVTAGLEGAFRWLVAGDAEVRAVVAAVTSIAQRDPAFATQALLAKEYPGDPGIALSLLLHDVRITAGEALFLPAGNIHAYLEGVGIELMTASDNVLRGGLTPKHVDVPELLDVLDFEPRPVPRLAPRSPSPGVREWTPPAGFRLFEVRGRARIDLTGPAILLALGGSAELVAGERVAVPAGGAVYVDDEPAVEIDGPLVFVATVA